MTLEHMRLALARAELPSGGTLLYFGEPLEADHALVMRAFDEIEKKVPLVAAGIDSFTEAEKLMFWLLNKAAALAYPTPHGTKKVSAVK